VGKIAHNSAERVWRSTSEEPLGGLFCRQTPTRRWRRNNCAQALAKIFASGRWPYVGRFSSGRRRVPNIELMGENVAAGGATCFIVQVDPVSARANEQPDGKLLVMVGTPWPRSLPFRPARPSQQRVVAVLSGLLAPGNRRPRRAGETRLRPHHGRKAGFANNDLLERRCESPC